MEWASSLSAAPHELSTEVQTVTIPEGLHSARQAFSEAPASARAVGDSPPSPYMSLASHGVAPNITVAICTRNRAAKLARAFDALLDMEIPDGLTWELVVIDNASTDRTPEVIAAYADRLPLRCETHLARGVSGARNAALRASRGQIIAWTDDDCMVDRTWMTTIWREFTTDPELGVLGGYVAPFLGDAAPSEPSAEPRMEVTTDGAMLLANLTRIATCNAAFSRAACSRVGEFDEQLGTGTWAGSAEDWDFVYRAVRSEVRVVFCPQMVVYHHHGRSQAELHGTNRDYAVGRGAFYCKHILKGDSVALAVAWYEIRAWTLSLWRHLVGVSRWISYLMMGAIHRVVRIP